MLRTISIFLATVLLMAAAPAALRAADHAHGAKGTVLFVLTNHGEMGDTGTKTGYYLSEVTHPWHVLTEAGYAVEFASPAGGLAPADPKSLDMDDPVNARFWNDEGLRAQLENTMPVADADPSKYDAVFFPGGHGTMWDLADSEALARTAAAVYESGGVVGAVCHGPAGLLNIRLSDGSYLVEGKRVAAFTNEEEAAVELTDVMPFLLETALRERGAEFVGAPNWQANVVADGRLVTGQNPASATGVGEEIVRLLDAMNTGTETADAKPGILGIPFETIDGKTTNLGAIDARAYLVVNTASRCGLTPQYGGLQELHEKFKERGLAVVAFPSNDFGGQEPLVGEQITAFCSDNYGVTFPVMAKVPTTGDAKVPLYAALTGPDSPTPGELSWNFEKFLVGADGKIIARFSPRVTPTADEVTTAIERALAGVE